MQEPYPDLDRWSYLDHRIGTPNHSTVGVAPGWLPQDQWRRISAYRFLDALNKNSTRWYMEWDEDYQRDQFVEMGDPWLFGDRIAAGVVGDQIELVVDGAEHPPPSVVPIAQEPTEPETGDEVSLAAYQAEVEIRAAQSSDIIDEWKQQWEDYPRLKEVQRWLQDWGKAEQFAAKVYEMESASIVPLGDGVMAFQWDERVKRPRMVLYDPDSYFPVLEGLDDGQWPEKVHIAWSYEEELPDGSTQEWVRRITYELVETAKEWDPKYSDGSTNRVCTVSDGRWRIDQFDDRTIDDLTVAAAVWTLNSQGEEMRDLPLGIDFIPIVHVPNGFAELEHFGQSSLSVGVQAFETLAQGDTDAAKASELAGTPQIAVSGAAVPPTLEMKKGIVWGLGENGSMDTIDQSAPLTALLDYNKATQERIERIVKVPAGILGRNANREIRSGVALQISNFPYDQEIGKLRLTRTPKYQLALKMVQRIAIQNGAGPSVVAPARVSFGSYLPSDLASSVTNVNTLINARAISRATGLRMLIDSGLDLDDAVTELERIRSEDTSGAVEVGNATGSVTAAANYLGIDLPEDAEETEPTESPGPKPEEKQLPPE